MARQTLAFNHPFVQKPTKCDVWRRFAHALAVAGELVHFPIG
jgi:hypothetical protein